jgi:methyl-accepting chemotaxis protein
MKGILPKITQDASGTVRGERLRPHSGNHGPSHLPAHHNYPDQVPGAEGRNRGRKDRKIATRRIPNSPLHIKGFHKLFPRSLKSDTLWEFYLTMNETHAR